MLSGKHERIAVSPTEERKQDCSKERAGWGGSTAGDGTVANRRRFAKAAEAPCATRGVTPDRNRKQREVGAGWKSAKGKKANSAARSPRSIVREIQPLPSKMGEVLLSIKQRAWKLVFTLREKGEKILRRKEIRTWRSLTCRGKDEQEPITETTAREKESRRRKLQRGL